MGCIFYYVVMSDWHGAYGPGVMMVCLAVWMYHAGRSVSDKLLAITLPILAFVASGSEQVRQVFVLLGKIVGRGIVFAGPYWFAWLRGEGSVTRIAKE